MTCVHCGKVLVAGAYWYNAWLNTRECRPQCEAGRLWYQQNTTQTADGRRVYTGGKLDSAGGKISAPSAC